MSLKAFHVVFVVCSVTLMLALSGWAYGQYHESGSSSYLFGTGAALAAALALLGYGVYFLKKLKHISYL